MDLRLKTPFSMLLIGATASGKTTKLKKILEERFTLFKEPPEKVYLFYQIWQKNYQYMLENHLVDEFFEGVPSKDIFTNLLKQNKSSCMIFDDLSNSIDSTIENLFTAGSHHYNVNTIFIGQNLYYNNPLFRTISRNSTYFILMRNPRDSSQLAVLSRQVFPGKKNFLPIVCKYVDIVK